MPHILTMAVVMEALGYGCHDNGLIFSLNAQLWTSELPLVKFGTPAQQQKYLPGLMAGDIIRGRAGGHRARRRVSTCTACGPPSSGRANDYVLNGTKTYITNAPIADMVVVFAAHPGKPPMSGLSAFLVEKGTPGFTVSRDMPKMGIRTSPMGEVVLDNCVVPAENRLGPEGAGMAIFNSSMTWERSCILASAVGVMQRQLEASSRRNDASSSAMSIGKFQAVSGKMADMYLRLEAARLLIYQAAWLGQQGKPALAEAAAAKLLHQRGVGRLEPGRDPDPRSLRLQNGKRRRARPAGRRRQHHLLRHVRDPAGHPGPDAGPLSHPDPGEEE